MKTLLMGEHTELPGGITAFAEIASWSADF